MVQEVASPAPLQPRRDWASAIRLGGLRRFAAAITLFNLLGHTLFGFEQSWAQPLVSVATGYAVGLLLEWAAARAERRRPAFRGSGVGGLIDFLLPYHISALAVAMLLYANDRLLVIAFATCVATASKTVFRLGLNGRTRHFLNPSNFGIAVTLLLFPWVGIAPPYHFTENLFGVWDWALPALIIVSGTYINATFTRRLPLIGAWLGGFALQAGVRHLLFGSLFLPSLLPLTGLAYVLFTFYMVTDPPTTPSSTRGQILFGLAVAAVYGFLVSVHVVFGLFFALSIVCGLRGLGLYALSFASESEPGASVVGVTAGRRAA